MKNNDHIINNNNNDILENYFRINDEDNNYGIMLNETDGFDKLINQLKQEKIEDDKNYEKEKEKEKQKINYGEDDYDINNFNYDTKEKEKEKINFSKNNRNENKINFFDDNLFSMNNKSNNNDYKNYNQRKEFFHENKEKIKEPDGFY